MSYENLMGGFVAECEERFDRVEEILLSSTDLSSVNLQIVKRDLHTLKGSSAAMGFANYARFVHAVEDSIERISDPSKLIDGLLAAVSTLRGSLANLSQGDDTTAIERQAAANGAPPVACPVSERADGTAPESAAGKHSLSHDAAPLAKVEHTAEGKPK